MNEILALLRKLPDAELGRIMRIALDGSSSASRSPATSSAAPASPPPPARERARGKRPTRKRKGSERRADGRLAVSAAAVSDVLTVIERSDGRILMALLPEAAGYSACTVYRALQVLEADGRIERTKVANKTKFVSLAKTPIAAE